MTSWSRLILHPTVSVGARCSHPFINPGGRKEHPPLPQYRLGFLWVLFSWDRRESPPADTIPPVSANPPPSVPENMRQFATRNRLESLTGTYAGVGLPDI